MRRFAVAITALAVAVGAVAIVVTSASGSSSPAPAPAKGAGAATVTRRDLVATDTESGTLGFADPQTVFNRLSGTITWLPAAGALIKPGQALYKVDGAPVVLFDGSTPAYRSLAAGVSDGADVEELNAGLVRLGFDPSRQITLGDTWQAATTAAVERWQAARGLTQTGTVALGQIVFLPGPQRVATVDATLGSTGNSSSAGAANATGASEAVTATRPVFVDLTTTVRPATRPPAAGSDNKPGAARNDAALVAALKAETEALKQSLLASRSRAPTSTRPASSPPATQSAAPASSAGSGTGTQPASPVLQTTSAKVIVSVDLDATKQSEATVGEAVSVQMPNGKIVNGKITQVSPVAQQPTAASSASSSGSGSTPTATIPVTIALSGKQAGTGLDQAAVSVNFQQQVVRHVLSVPVTALLATAGGGYELQQASAPHRLIPVTPGLFAAGYVQVSGSGLYSGLRVTASQG